MAICCAVEELAGAVLGGFRFIGFLVLLGIVAVLYYLTRGGGDMYSKENVERYQQ
jgi:hypothetical protein